MRTERAEAEHTRTMNEVHRLIAKESTSVPQQDAMMTDDSGNIENAPMTTVVSRPRTKATPAKRLEMKPSVGAWLQIGGHGCGVISCCCWCDY